MTTPTRRPVQPGRTDRSRRPLPQKRRLPPTTRRSFLERNRNALIWGAVGIGLVALAAFAFIAFTAPAYGCTTDATWTPTPTQPPAPGTSPRIGYLQPDMGNQHDAVGTPVTYVYCPPASGKHWSQTGVAPIQPRLYGPDEKTVPEDWVHNLEHGALVLVYKCPGPACTTDGQAALKQFAASFPNSPICNLAPGIISPVITRFDDMAFPYAALIWDNVLPLQTLDTEQILAFFKAEAERANPEHLCAAPSASPGPSTSPSAPSTTAPSSTAPAASPSGAPGSSTSPAASPT